MANLATKLNEHNMLLRILAYGSAKTKKTWWAGKAAESNFNVLILDGDDGWHILKNIDPKYHNRINVINMVDTHKVPTFCLGATQLLKEYKLVWDEEKKCSSKLQPNANCIYPDLSKLTHNDVLVLDSWTALCWSLSFQYAKENGLDLSDAQKSEWDGYGWSGRLATWVLNQLQAVPCHVIVIAHQTMYEKRSKDGKTVEMQRQQILSVSGNHAMTVPSKFSDILTFSQRAGIFKISSIGDWDKDGGARVVPPNVYDWDKLQFVDVVKLAGNTVPDETNTYLDLKTPFSQPAKPQLPNQAVQQTAKPTAVQPVQNKPIIGGTVNTNLKTLVSLAKPNP